MDREFNIDVSEAFTLWLPSDLVTTVNNADHLRHELKIVSEVNAATAALLEDATDEDTYLDFVESHGIDMDEYVAVAQENLRYLFGNS